MRWGGVLALLGALLSMTGCSVLFAPSSAGDLDGGSDGAAPACETDLRPRHLDPCALPDSQGPLSLTASGYPYLLDTSDGTFEQFGSPIDVASGEIDQRNAPQTGPRAFVVVADSITIEEGAELTVYGDLPLFLVSMSTITIDGRVEVSSGGQSAGAADCLPTAPTESSAGSAGGSFQGRGGDGGDGYQGSGGEALEPISLPDYVRAGCPGAIPAGGDEGDAAPGGGALYLVAPEQISVSGVLQAGGEGGRGGSSSRGAAGGGSGGMLELGAKTITVAAGAVLAANGGGGGSGKPSLGSGDDGEDGRDDDQAAAGGRSGSSSSGDGGQGGAGSTLDGEEGEAKSSGYGGGGGGAVGFIVLDGLFTTVDSEAIVSPPRTPRGD